MHYIEIIRLTDVWPDADSCRLEVQPMTMIERPIDLDEVLRVSAGWWKDRPTNPVECECPDPCLIDHDN